MSSEAWLDEFEAEQALMRERYGSLLDEMTVMLFRIDPAGVSYADDEYETEALYILRRLPEATRSEDVVAIVTDVLVSQFGDDWYRDLREVRMQKRDDAAAEIWNAWVQYRSTPN